jgi:hypothetical protein
MLRPDFSQGISRGTDGYRYAVGDWDDSVGTLFAHLSDFGSPISYLLPLPEGHVFALTLKTSVHGATTALPGRVFSFEDSMKEFILHTMSQDSPVVTVSRARNEVVAATEAVPDQFIYEVATMPVAA